MLWLILAATLIRLGFAASLGLGIDESYMVTAGRIFSLGYFDHPPAAWWLSWAAGRVFGDTAFAVRLPFITLFAGSTWLMFRLGAAAVNERAGFWAAFALNLSPVLGVTTGTWVLPDGPLVCALLGAALCLMHAVNGRGWRWWLGAGACAGLALFSKYSAILTIGGAFLFLLTCRQHRRWLVRPEPYVAVLLALAIFSPVVIWNARHGWASFAFQGGRAGVARFRPMAPLVTLAGEALFILPWIWVPLVVSAARALRRGPGEWRGWLLCCLGAPPIVAFVTISVWSPQRVLYHWAAPGYLMLFPLLGAMIVRLLDGGSRTIRPVLAGTAMLVAVLVTGLGTGVRFDWLHPAVKIFALKTDPTVEGIDWLSLRTELLGRGLLHRPGTVVGAANWRDAGKIGFALGGDVMVICLDPDARQFGIIDPASNHVGQDVLILLPSHAERAMQNFSKLFENVETLPPVTIRHAGRDVAEVAVRLGHRLRAFPQD